MNLILLNSSANDALLWKKYLNQLPFELQDIHYAPEYANIYKDTYGYETYLLVLKESKKLYLQPFSLKPLNLLNLKFETNGIFEASHPYGFGGLISNINSVNNANDIERFENKLLNILQEKAAVTEFVLCHPLLKNHRFIQNTYTVTQEKEVVYIDLSLPTEKIKSQFNRGTRSNIKHALNIGIKIKKVIADQYNLNIFQKLYYKTMERKHADLKWLFPNNYFSNCLKYLGDRRISLLFAYFEKKVVAAYLLMHDYEIAYYHFGASDEANLHTRATSLLMAESISYLKSKGYKKYHLGGGVSSKSDDSLLQFKKGFSKLKTPLYSYHRIINKKLYEQLNLAKIKNEKDNHEIIENPNYFPLYKRS